MYYYIYRDTQRDILALYLELFFQIGKVPTKAFAISHFEISIFAYLQWVKTFTKVRILGSYDLY